MHGRCEECGDDSDALEMVGRELLCEGCREEGYVGSLDDDELDEFGFDIIDDEPEL